MGVSKGGDASLLPPFVMGGDSFPVHDYYLEPRLISAKIALFMLCLEVA
jgi:hypothetical protein